MSSKRLLEEFPRPDQNAKQQGLTKEQAKDQYEQQLKAKQQEAESQIIVTGNDNLDKAQQQLAKLQGPNRIIAELSMAKVDRAVYSNRQLQAVMEDFWFNHFNVFANKGDDKWLLTAYERDTIRPHAMGKFQDLLLATAKSPAMLFFLDNYLSADPAAVARHGSAEKFSPRALSRRVRRRLHAHSRHVSRTSHQRPSGGESTSPPPRNPSAA